MKRYAVHEAFLTLQGEGAHAGRRAVFVRFAGCNVWNGREADRQRDTAKGCCAAWCDTKFVGTHGSSGGVYEASRLGTLIHALWDCPSEQPLAVFTGGEPSLQIDEALVSEIGAQGIRMHVETNGSGALPAGLDWVTLSPKPPMRVVQQHYDEVKVVFPAGFDPREWAGYAPLRFIQPLDNIESKRNIEKCIQFVFANPSWRLSTQTHKALGLR